MEIRRYGAGSPQIVRRLHALYDHLARSPTTASEPRVDARAPAARRSGGAAFPDPEEREIVERADRLGLGCEP